MNTLLSHLPPTTAKASKRVGRGYGSGKGGHTTGRGAKGDKVRGKTKITFDGAKIKKGWIKRLPFLRGKHRNLKRTQTVVYRLDQIDKMFSKGATVSPSSFKSTSVKILSGGQITKPLNLQNIKVSALVRKQIIAVGGTISQ